MICVSFEDMSTLYRVALYADVKDTSFWDVFLKKLGIFFGAKSNTVQLYVNSSSVPSSQTSQFCMVNF